MHSPAAADPCPCGRDAFGSCCGPVLAGDAKARTAEMLMRSRYTAFATGDSGYLWRTWHPRTRPGEVQVDTATQWVGLEVLDIVDGMPGDDAGIVEFEALYRRGWRVERQRERSRFEYRASQWLYLDGNDDSA